MSARRAVHAAILSIVAGSASASAIPGSYEELCDLRAACRSRPWRTVQASGYDRGGGFFDSGNFVRTDPGPKYILVEAEGPGCIDRLWFTRKSEGELYDLELYLDDRKAPAVRIDLDALASGTREPFTAPFAGRVDKSLFCYAPIGFERSLTAALVPTAPAEKYQRRENSAGETIPHVYYQITYRRLSAGSAVRPFRRGLDAEGRAAFARAAALWSDAGSWPWGGVPELREVSVERQLEPGSAAELLAAEGPGVIYGVEIDAPARRDLWIEMRWDGNLAVSAPLGAFFASPAFRPAGGLWIGCRSGRLYCHLPMPFRSGGRISVRAPEGGAGVSVRARTRWRAEALGADDLAFHASYYDHNPPRPGEDYVVLDVTGRGHFAGIAMDRPGNMEGDDRFFVDGETVPSIHGTGTEDFFTFAWGFEHIASLPLHGISDQEGARACYRFLFPSGVPFTRSLRVSWEHGSGNTHRGRYSGVAYYYRAMQE